jgi:hypothetical protein
MTELPRDVTINYDPHDVVANDDHAIALGTATAKRGDDELVSNDRDLPHPRWPGDRALAFSDDTAAIIDFFGPTEPTALASGGYRGAPAAAFVEALT